MDELSSLKLPELKKECKARGLSTVGNKADLVSRLQHVMSNEKPPSDDSVLDDALIDEDSMLDDDSGADEDSTDLADLTTGTLDLSSPTSKIPPTSISKVIGSPVKIPVVVPVSPIKKVEAVKRPASNSPSKTQSNGDTELSSPVTKKKITINRESVQAAIIETAESKNIGGSSSTDEEEKKVVKIGTVPLTADEKARLRAEKFGATTTTDVPGVKSTAAAGNEKSTPIFDEKRKKRAERFNNGTNSVTTSSESKVVSLTTEDDVKLAKRKERFGLVEESTKKETRAARFSGSAAAPPSSAPSTTISTDSGDKKTLRAARFNTAT